MGRPLKVDKDTAASIKATLAAHPQLPKTYIANLFGVSDDTIRKIARGQQWADVEPSGVIPLEWIPGAVSESGFRPERASKDFKASSLASYWADKLRENPDRIEPLLYKLIKDWPDHKIDAALIKTSTRTIKPTED